MDALLHAKTHLPRNQKTAWRGHQIIELGAILAADLDQILESLGSYEGRFRAFSFEQRIGGDRGAVYDLSLNFPGCALNAG